MGHDNQATPTARRKPILLNNVRINGERLKKGQELAPEHTKALEKAGLESYIG